MSKQPIANILYRKRKVEFYFYHNFKTSKIYLLRNQI